MIKDRKNKNNDTKALLNSRVNDRSIESRESKNRLSSDTDSSRSHRIQKKSKRKKSLAEKSPIRKTPIKILYQKKIAISPESNTKEKETRKKLSCRPSLKKEQKIGEKQNKTPTGSRENMAEREKEKETSRTRPDRSRDRNRDSGAIRPIKATYKTSTSEEQESFETVEPIKTAPVHVNIPGTHRREKGRSLIGLDGESDLDTERGAVGTQQNVTKNGKKKITSPQLESPEKSSSETKDSVSLAEDQEGREIYKKVFKDFAMMSQKQTYDASKEEYNSLPEKPTADRCTAYYHSANESKNRYANIPCLDVSRVKLHFMKKKTGDYIHANFVTSKYLTTKYILTQAPKKNTRADFWAMIWQEKTTMIVMLCQFVEQNREKCAEYFPVTHDKPFVFTDMDMKLTFEDSTTDKSFVTTKLRLEHRDESRIITHFQWMEWPDYQVPGSSETMLKLLRKIRGKKTPPVIHCAAGVGRSGTLMAIEIALMSINNHCQIPDIPAIVSEMRQNGRCMAVQTLQQYMLIRKVVLDFGASNRLLSEESYNRYSTTYMKALRNENNT